MGFTLSKALHKKVRQDFDIEIVMARDILLRYVILDLTTLEN